MIYFSFYIQFCLFVCLLLYKLRFCDFFFLYGFCDFFFFSLSASVIRFIFLSLLLKLPYHYVFIFFSLCHFLSVPNHFISFPPPFFYLCPKLHLRDLIFILSFFLPLLKKRNLELGKWKGLRIRGHFLLSLIYCHSVFNCISVYLIA